MKHGKNESGMTFISFIFLMVILGFLALFGLKLIPIFLESWKIDTGLKAVIEEPGVSTTSRREIRESLLKRWDIDGVTRINHHTFEQYVDIAKDRGQVAINVEYEAETPLVGNLTLVANFNKSVSNY